MIEHAAAETVAAPGRFFGTIRAAGAFFRRNLTPRTAVAVTAWRIETLILTPLAIFFIEAFGRWEGALAMATVMAAFSLLFVFLLDGEPVINEFRKWVGERGWGRWSMRIAERRDRTGVIQRALSVPATIMVFGPFWRSVTYHLFLVRRPLAYLFAVGGAFPHTMFWTGVVFGGVWGLAVRPGLVYIWESAIEPAINAVG